MITRDQLLGSFKRRYTFSETILGPLRIRNLTEEEKEEFEAGNLDKEGKLNLRAVRKQRRKLFVALVVDDEGNPLLPEPGDVERLKGVDSAVTAAVFRDGTKHCGFTDDELDELEKNFAEATADDSPID